MNNEPNKPIPAQELTEKELEGVVGGGIKPLGDRYVVQKLVYEINKINLYSSVEVG